MKPNNQIFQLFYSRVARVGFGSMITLLSWGLITPQAQAGFGSGQQIQPPPSGETTQGSGQDFPEGSGVLGEGTIVEFTDFSVDNNSNLPDNVISNGDGSLLDLVNTAADVWTIALPEFEDIQINVGWADFGLEPLAQSSALFPDEVSVVEGFQNTQDTFLLTSTLNTPSIIRSAFTEEVDEDFGSFPIIDDGVFITESQAEIDEFEETFIRVSPEDTEIDGLAAIFIPSIFEADQTIPQGDTFPSAGTILFNSQDLEFDVDRDGDLETIQFFLDDNPLDSEVFGSATNLIEETGTGSLDGINIGRSSFADNSAFPIDEDDENVLVVDLFSVVLHELQHALGTSRTNQAAIDEINSNGNQNIVTEDREIPTNFEPSVHIDLDTNELNTPTPVGLETVTFGERKCPSAVDVLAVAEVSNFNEGELNINPCQALATPVSESSPILPLLFFGTGGLFLTRQRFSSQNP